MKLYLAGRFSRREEINDYAKLFRVMGYDVTSRWLLAHDEEWSAGPSFEWQERAEIDLEDIDKSDAVVSFTEARGTLTTGGGRHVEFGYGYAKGKRLIVIGPRENVFHHLPGIEFYNSLEDMIEYNKPARAKKKVGA